MARTVTLAGFKRTLSKRAPPARLSLPLAAMWWAAKGKWDKAHDLVMNDEGAEAAWVHAYLHRVEGDLGNARYWYRQASRTPQAVPLAAEWDDITATLLETVEFG